MNSQEKSITTATGFFLEELCTFYLHIQDYEHATECAMTTLTNDPHNSSALLAMGLVNEAQRNLPTALSFYKDLLKIHPDDTRALKRKAVVELDLEMDKKALLDINRALANDSSDSESYLIRGMIYFYAYQEKIGAIIDYNQALKLDPENSKALFHRGFAYLKYGNLEYAGDDFIRAGALGYKEAGEMLRIYFPGYEFRPAI